MRYIADLHIHSKYSRACSANLTPSNIAAWARAKGIDVIATGDFTHPKWLKDLETKLEPAEPGLYRLRPKFAAEDGAGSYVAAPQTVSGREVRFLFSTEIACIYKKGGRTRRLHLVIFAPHLAAAKRFVTVLEKREFNLSSDGRPILGLDAKELLKICLDADCLLVPAHAWTPWFSVFGSESGFDSLEECFGELAREIPAIETGLSSDPPMNWRLSALDSVALISNSDAHGLNNLGREANVFDLNRPSFAEIMGAIRKRDPKRFLFTVEFFPEEGKYHVDGHRTCDFFCLPQETTRLKGLCPKCGQPLTRGVLGRVHELADRPESEGGAVKIGYRRLVPLAEIIAEALGKGKAAKAVGATYAQLIGAVGSEFDVLLDAPLEAIAAASSARVAEAVGRVRQEKLLIRPGYDGLFGQVKIFETGSQPSQTRLMI